MDQPELFNLSDVPERVLVIVAHPDDIDFGVAGTAGALTKAGSEVVYACCTSGEAGIPEDMDRAELQAMREREQRAAAAEMGVNDVRFLGLADGRLEPNLELRRDISRVIRQVRPTLVITQNPERRWDRIYGAHPDHLAVGEATICAVYPDSRNPHSHPELLAEGLEPHAVPEVWVAGLDPVDVFIDITDVIDQKVRALSSHSSQVAWIDDVDKLLRNWATETGARHGFPEGTLIEAFRRIATS